MKIARQITLVSLVVLFASLAAANVKLPVVFGDNMVLQRNSEVAVWGWADPGEEITVSACWKASAKTKAAADGKWSVKIKTPKAGGPHELTIKGNYTITLKNILIGEVWVCSGQSNMQWFMRGTADPEKNIAKANYPKIRLFTVQSAVAAEPQDDCKGNWVECSPKTVTNFSAVGYYFGKHLFDEMNVPIGLISTNWGGTLALWVLAKDYGKKDIVYSGPIYKSMKVEGDKIRLSFDYTGSGLKTIDGKEVSHLTIAGADKKFVEAKGVIDGNTVVVSADGVTKPVSVRHGWSNTAEPNLANKEGLPASSFRADDWPGVSFEVR